MKKKWRKNEKIQIWLPNISCKQPTKQVIAALVIILVCFPVIKDIYINEKNQVLT